MEQAPPCLFWSLTSFDFFLQVRQIASLTEQVKNETARAVRAEQKVEAFRNQVAQQNADIHAMATELTVGRLKIAELQKELDKAHALFTGFRLCFFPVEGKHAEEGAEGARQGASGAFMTHLCFFLFFRRRTPRRRRGRRSRPRPVAAPFAFHQTLTCASMSSIFLQLCSCSPEMQLSFRQVAI